MVAVLAAIATFLAQASTTISTKGIGQGLVYGLAAIGPGIGIVDRSRR